MPDGGDDYRARKYASISDLTGTSMLELVLVSTPIPMGLWLLAETNALVMLRWRRSFMPTVGWRGFVSETFLVPFPALASMLWPSWTTTLLLMMACASVGCRCAERNCLKTASDKPARNESGQIEDSRQEKPLQDRWPTNSLSLPRMNFVTNFRASIMIMTCITILAVDFHIFPRRFAKTEVFGTGLMDLGVGATVFASGLASGCRTKPQGRNANAGLPVWRAILTDVASAAFRAWPLAALGVSRLVVTKGLRYQEHVSEYGVHWNFFATLFCIRMVVVPMNQLHSARMRLWLALCAVCIYQYFLVCGGLSAFIVDAPRDTLFSMNREGVLGLVGFVAIYFIAKELGSQIWAHRQKHDKEVNDALYSSSCVSFVTSATIILWGLTLLSDRFIQQTSRRMVNLTYVLWVSAHSTLMLNLLMLVDIVSLKPPRSLILAAVNLNLFPVFMAANLATGAINMSMRTLDADTVTAVGIMSVYIVLVVGFAALLSDRAVVLKV